jgi:hypothetical protein
MSTADKPWSGRSGGVADERHHDAVFSSPLDNKAKVAVRGNGFEGFGHHYSRASNGKLDWAESMILITQPVKDRNMEMWPTNPPTFRSAVHILASLCLY